MKKRVVSLVVLCALVGAVGLSMAQMPRMRGQAGPPAPVPEEVAIVRPSAEEIEAMNAELQRFVENNTSDHQDLLKKYAALVRVNPPRDNPCIRPTPGIRYGRHDAFVEIANTQEFDILFHGDSITDWWQMPGAQGGGSEVFQKYFGDKKVANFAVAGDTTQGLLWGLQNGEGQGHKPKVVMLMIGTNSAGSSSGEEIAEGVGAVVLQLRKDFPDAKILLLAIFPRGSGPDDSLRQTNEVANKIIPRLADDEHVFFMNINDRFLNDQGGLVGFRGDNLHPNAEGYEIWASVVAPVLDDLLK